MFQVIEGDCLDVLKTMPDCSVDAVITDPPYGLSQHTPEQVKDCLLAWCKGEVYQPKGKGFMGKTWDAWVPGPEVWKEVLRVLKPGGHALVFAGTRSMDLMSMSLRLAGFELRDSIGHAYDDSDSDAAPLLAWVHGQGFPKNLDISKQIDKLHGAEREVVGKNQYAARRPTPQLKDGVFSSKGPNFGGPESCQITAPATPDAEKWDGFGTAIKPSWEPILLCRKPLASSCINVLGMIESQLRKQGVTGDILWKPESARDAAKSKKTTNSDSIKHSEPSVTSAKTAAENETQKTGLQTQRNSGTLGTNGIKQIQEGNENSRENLTETCENKSSQPTVGSVSAAEKLSTTSLPLTTSTEGEHSTANKSTEKSTPNCGVKDFHPDTESFAGIVTGLTGSMATVHISRDSDGMFLWPTGLPKNIPSKTLTVAENVLKHGTGGLNIGACRIGTDGEERPLIMPDHVSGFCDVGRPHGSKAIGTTTTGRWPANVVLSCSCDGADHSESCPVSQFPDVKGGSVKPYVNKSQTSRCVASFSGLNGKPRFYKREAEPLSSAARFFYTAKASKRDRDEGLENLPKTVTDDGRNKSIDNPYQRGETLRHNPHPTVKATPLMRWLVRLISPPGAVILDPFCGSGSTGKAAVLEGFEFIGIEQDPESVMVAKARIAWAAGEPAPTLPPSAENDEQETAVTAPERPKQLSLFGV